MKEWLTEVYFAMLFGSVTVSVVVRSGTAASPQSITRAAWSLLIAIRMLSAGRISSETMPSFATLRAMRTAPDPCPPAPSGIGSNAFPVRTDSFSSPAPSRARSSRTRIAGT